ncbi:MAG TPA: glycosyltransferase [Vicinamibacterales bacterium]|nr:glycosyltransferase [Vicinamibacterales bacterium]
MSHASISFIIPVRNDAARLRHCLRSIARSATGRDDVEVIVADNGSTDASADVARAEGAAVIELAGLRVGALRNRAAALARGTLLAFVDADHEIAPGWIAAASEVLADLSVGGVGAPCHPPASGTWVQKAYDRLRRHSRGRTTVEWLGSGNLAVRRAAFLAAGGFDTTLETCEDVDLCRRIRALGLTLVSDSRLGNIHYGDPGTLRDVYAGELWRGRDNVRVSLRAPRSTRTLVSAAIPVVNLTALAAIPAGLATMTTGGAMLAAGGALWIGVIVGLRATLMMGRPAARPRATLPQIVAVAAVYEAGRALALVARAGHRRRGDSTTPARGVA